MSADAIEALKNLSTEETFRVRSKAMALNLLDVCYDHVTSEAEPAPFSQKLDMLKTAAKFADLEPKQALPGGGAGGASFSIRVVYSGAGRGSVTIDHEDVVLEIDAPPTYLAPSRTTDALASLVLI